MDEKPYHEVRLAYDKLRRVVDGKVNESERDTIILDVTVTLRTLVNLYWAPDETPPPDRHPGSGVMDGIKRTFGKMT